MEWKQKACELLGLENEKPQEQVEKLKADTEVVIQKKIKGPGTEEFYEHCQRRLHSYKGC